MRCRYCKEPVGLARRLRGSSFCCQQHESLFRTDRQSSILQTIDDGSPRKLCPAAIANLIRPSVAQPRIFDRCVELLRSLPITNPGQSTNSFLPSLIAIGMLEPADLAPCPGVPSLPPPPSPVVRPPLDIGLKSWPRYPALAEYRPSQPNPTPPVPGRIVCPRTDPVSLPVEAVHPNAPGVLSASPALPLGTVLSPDMQPGPGIRGPLHASPVAVTAVIGTSYPAPISAAEVTLSLPIVRGLRIGGADPILPSQLTLCKSTVLCSGKVTTRYAKPSPSCAIGLQEQSLSRRSFFLEDLIPFAGHAAPLLTAEPRPSTPSVRATKAGGAGRDTVVVMPAPANKSTQWITTGVLPPKHPALKPSVRSGVPCLNPGVLSFTGAYTADLDCRRTA